MAKVNRIGTHKLSLQRQSIGDLSVLLLGPVAEHDQIPGDTARTKFPAAERGAFLAEGVGSPAVSESARIDRGGKIDRVGHLHPGRAEERAAPFAEIGVQKSRPGDVECGVGAIFAPAVEVTEYLPGDDSIRIHPLLHQPAEYAEISGILHVRRSHLLEIVDAAGTVRPRPGLIERGQQQGRQNRNNCNYKQQFY